MNLRILCTIMGWSILGLARGWGVDLDEYSPRRMAVSLDGKLIAMASEDKRVRIWDSASGKLLHVLELDLPGTAVAFAPDGTMLIAGTSGTRKDASQPTRGHLYAWSFSNKESTLLWKSPIVGRTMAIAVEPRGKWLVANTVYATLRTYRMVDGELLRNWVERGNSPTDLALSPDGKTIVTAGQALILWDSTKPKLADEIVDSERPLSAELSTQFMRARTAGSVATTVSSDGEWAIAVGYFANTRGRPVDVAQLDMKTAKIKSLVVKELEGITSVALSPNDKTLAIGLNEGSIVTFDMERMQQKAKWTRGGHERLRSITYLDNGKKLAVASEGGRTLVILDTATGRHIKRLWPTE